MKKIILVILTLLFSITSISYSQTTQIEAQRPTIAESYGTINQNIFQVESGAQKFNNSISYGSFVRFGLFDQVELRLSADYQSFDNINGSFKFVVTEQKKILPGIAVALSFQDDIKDYKVIATKSVGDIGITLNYGKNLITRYGIFNLSHSITDNVFGFSEYYYGFNSNVDEIRAGAGSVFLDHFQADVHVGIIEYDSVYAGIGFSFKLGN